LFSSDVGWRLAFGLGVVVAVGILFVRSNVPESPRWMFIHGHSKDAEALVGEIERDVEESTGSELKPARRSIKVREQEQVGFITIARTVLAPIRGARSSGCRCSSARRFHNAVSSPMRSADHAYGTSAASAVHHPVRGRQLPGPLVLGRLFDSVGRSR
jgi:hypothetical protein